MKRFLAIMLSVFSVVSFAACSKDETNKRADLYSAVYDTKGYFKDIKASNYVTFDNLEDIELDWAKIENKIQLELDYHKPSETITDKERVIEDGDFVNITYTGYINGKTFSNSSQTRVVIETGSSIDYYSAIELYIANQCVGHKIGEDFEVTMTLSEDNSSYAGKEANFKVTINSVIEYSKIKWNNAFVEEHYGDSLGITTTKEAEQIMINDELYDLLYDNATFNENIPESLIKWMYDMNVLYLETASSKSGMTLEEYLNYYDFKDLDEFYEANLESYIDQVKTYLFLQALAEHYEYVVSDEDIETYVKKYNERNSTQITEDDLIGEGGLNYLRAMIMYDNLQEQLSDIVNVTIINKD